ncbi:MAG: efflux RND transporter periplasmic adaptor subunit [Anaerolineae bacterium]|nr:efflux RND transporter periplasmic adaptor subunit [Gloeobacterales cyanobacterium ES-bin-313]
MADSFDTFEQTTLSEKSRRNWWPLIIGLGMIGGGAFWLHSLGEEGSQKPPAKKPVVVTVAVAQQRTIPVQLRSIGNVEATSSVALKAQVDGQLMQVHFTQGQFVRKGQLLFTLDNRSLIATLNQAQSLVAKDNALVRQSQAMLSRDQAQLRTAQVQVKRYQSLLSQGAVSQEQFDTIRTTAETSAATIEVDRANVINTQAVVEADQAAVRNAQVQLGYTEIFAPIDGRTGSLSIYAGNLVRASDTSPLVIINRVSPIYVTFTVPEQQLTAIRRVKNLPVSASASGDKGHSVRGSLSFIDNAVDATTGTIKLKASFANPDNYLVPGQFVDVTTTLAELPNAVLVPLPAVQVGQQGQFVFVVKPDSSVEMKPITTTRTYQGMAVIEGGKLSAGETVVTDGQLQLVPGAKVTTKGAKP